MNTLRVVQATKGGALRNTGQLIEADEIGCDQPTDALFSSLPLNHAIISIDDMVDEDDDYAADIEWGMNMCREPAHECNHNRDGYDPRLHGNKKPAP